MNFIANNQNIVLIKEQEFVMKKQGSNTTKRTRLQKSFQQTVLKLYRKKNVDEITINEVCDKLGVPRSSFYYHYQTIRDVVSEIENDFLRVTKGALATIPFTGNEKTDYVNALTTLIPIVKNHENAIKAFAYERHDAAFLREWASLLSTSFAKEPTHRERILAYIAIFGIGDYLNKGVSLSSFNPDAVYEVAHRIYEIKTEFYSTLTK